jgi:hypothetical protein
MTRRTWAVALVALAWLVGCGAADKSGAAAQSPGRGGYGYRGRIVATSESARSDGDGILDDDVPAEAGPVGAPAPAPAPPPPPPAPGRPDDAAPGAGASAPTLPQDSSQEDKRQLIIYTARITMAVYQVDQGLATVEKIAADNGGYLANKRDREITVRVPRPRFEAALAAIDKIGDVLHREIQAQDVTDEYVDTEIRIKNARAMQARLRQLLERAAVKEALEIEKELARVTQELELLEGKLKLLKDRIAYSTITVVFEPRGARLHATRIRLPFPWLSQLGLPNLLSLEEVK